MPTQSSQNIALASYILPVGWVVAFISRLLTSDNSPFVIFHLRQGLGLALLELLVYIIIYKILDLWLVMQLSSVLFIVLIIYGLRSAQNGTMSPQPLIGKAFHNLFSFIK